jgi:hypothetical protein
MVTSAIEQIQIKIVDLGNHSARAIERLRQLLTDGAAVRPDAHRPGFFDVESASDTYFIHLSPVTGNILLLATWTNEACDDASRHNHLSDAAGQRATSPGLQP